MSGQGLCPALYRDGDRFVCRFVNSEVDPGVMPCLGGWTECPIYVRANKSVLAQRPEPQPPKPEAGERREEEREEATAGEEVLHRLGDVEKLVGDLEEEWGRYERMARDVLKVWYEVRREAERVLAGLESAIATGEEELQALEVRRKLELLSEDLYEELSRGLRDEVTRFRELRDAIAESVSRIERRVRPHYQRVKVAVAKPDIGRLRLSLMKLEQLMKAGRVSPELYKRLRAEIEEEIRRLERLAE